MVNSLEVYKENLLKKQEGVYCTCLVIGISIFPLILSVIPQFVDSCEVIMLLIFEAFKTISNLSLYGYS